MSMPALNYPITPIKLIDQPNEATQPNGSLKNNSSHNSVTESPLTVLHQSLSTSNGAYPDTQRPRAQRITDSKFNDVDQSSSSVINEIDDESESTSAKNENIDGAESTPLKNKKNSSLLSPEKLKYLVETVDRNKINKIDGLIQGLKNKADQLEEKIKKLNEIVEDSEDVVGKDDYPGQINSLRETLRKTRKRIDQLKDKSEHIERSVVPDAKSQNEIMKFCTELLNSCKSEKTRALDKKYDDMVKELIEQNEQSNYTRAQIAVAGASGFGVSFLIGNTLPRAIVMSPYIPPFISGFLHVVTATPVAKSIMPSNWTSPALSALTNNFKLRGDSWGDWWRGQTKAKKYLSKDTEHKGKISIEQKLKEERGFGGLFGARYKDEEASYYFYTLNYCFKAIGAALISGSLGTASLAYKITEGVLHGFCGAMSGAEYLMFQQFARSNREGSKNTPTLTRKIFAAKAEALRSLQADVEKTIENYDSDPAHDASDPIHRLLIKASTKVGEDLRIATRQASMLGLLKHEFITQFAHGNRLDTIAEILGRILSLMPTAAVNDLTAEWRKSSDPMLVFAAHTLSAIVLIAPPGFTFRPLYVGMIRACLQAMCNIYENKTAPEDKTAPVDDEDDDSLVGSVDSNDDWLDEYFDTGWHGNPTARDENAGL